MAGNPGILPAQPRRARQRKTQRLACCGRGTESRRRRGLPEVSCSKVTSSGARRARSSRPGTSTWCNSSGSGHSLMACWPMSITIKLSSPGPVLPASALLIHPQLRGMCRRLTQASNRRIRPQLWLSNVLLSLSTARGLSSVCQGRGHCSVHAEWRQGLAFAAAASGEHLVPGVAVPRLFQHAAAGPVLVRLCAVRLHQPARSRGPGARGLLAAGPAVPPGVPAHGVPCALQEPLRTGQATASFSSESLSTEELTAPSGISEPPWCMPPQCGCTQGGIKTSSASLEASLQSFLCSRHPCCARLRLPSLIDRSGLQQYFTLLHLFL